MEMMALTGTLDYKAKKNKSNYTLYKKAKIGEKELDKNIRIYNGCREAIKEDDSSVVYHAAKIGNLYHVFAVDEDKGRSVSDRAPIERRHGRIWYATVFPVIGVLMALTGVPGGQGVFAVGVIGALMGINLPPSAKHIESYLQRTDSQRQALDAQKQEKEDEASS